MIFTVDGVAQEKRDWLIRIVGPATDDSYRVLESCELESNVLYANTINGAVVVLRIDGLRLGCEIPPKKLGAIIETFRAEIILRNDEADKDIITLSDRMERGEVIHKTSTGGGKHGEIGLGDLPSTKRAFETYQAMQRRRERRDWLPNEMPLCPECLVLDTGHAAKERHYCHRHLWLDENHYDGWSVQISANRIRVMGPLKARIIDMSKKPIEELPQRRIVSPKVAQCNSVQVDNSRPAPESFTDLETLKKFGNWQIQLHKAGTEAYNREHWKYTEDLKAWAEKCLDESKDYIAALRARMDELQKSPVVLAGGLPEDAPGIQISDRELEFADNNTTEIQYDEAEVERLKKLLETSGESMLPALRSKTETRLAALLTANKKGA